MKKTLLCLSILLVALGTVSTFAQTPGELRPYLKAIQVAASAPKAPKGEALLACLLDATLRQTPKESNARVEVKKALLALAYFCDTQQVLEGNFLTRRSFKGLWSKDQRRRYGKKAATLELRGRRDLVLHFMLSMANSLLMGDAMASSLGVIKENSDAKKLDEGKGTGFSFCDLLANEAGIRLARLAKEAPTSLKTSKAKNLNRFMPSLKGLPEGLGLEKFKKDFGGTADKRFHKKMKSIRDRINACPAYRRKPDQAPRTQRSKTRK